MAKDKNRQGEINTAGADPGVSADHRAIISYLADIETLRHLDIIQFEFYDKIENAAGDATDFIESYGLKPGWTYEILNMVALNEGSGISQAALGYMSGSTFMILKKGSTDNPFHTVEYHHRVMLKETDKIRCLFSNATANDNLYLFANGVKRRI